MGSHQNITYISCKPEFKKRENIFPFLKVII